MLRKDLPRVYQELFKKGEHVMIPKDPAMLLSYINLKLRDYYPSLEAFYEDTGEDMEKIVNQLKQIDYHYNREKNQFV